MYLEFNILLFFSSIEVSGFIYFFFLQEDLLFSIIVCIIIIF